MILIEFFDHASVENIIGALACEPERVILIGDKRKHMQKGIAVYEQLLRSRGIQTEIRYMVVNKNNLPNIVSVLSQIVEQNEDCVFDLTGGEDLYLVAVGAVMQQYQGRVQCHRFNLQNGVVYDCDADGIVCSMKPIDISVKENILIYGGKMVEDEQSGLYTYPWDFGEEALCDIEAMWNICKKNARLWNVQIGLLGSICELQQDQNVLSITFHREDVIALTHRADAKILFAPWIFYELESQKLIESLAITDNAVSFVFKNKQVKRCLTIAGQVLELTVASKMRALTDAKGQQIYHDVRVGVVIDWDVTDEESDVRTINEIDVLAMKGACPIFISCKNGNFDSNEAYKLSTVAERFGAHYAKKVVIATELEKLGDRAEYLRARMVDMKIRCVEDVDAMSDTELERVLKTLWSN